MALPMDFDNLRSDESSERASSVEDYKVTCMAFIKDISGDYLEWVDYYKLPPDEDKKRRAEIAAIVERTNDWIAKISQSIKGVDVVMNDGGQKMGEATAGRSDEQRDRRQHADEHRGHRSHPRRLNVKASG